MGIWTEQEKAHGAGGGQVQGELFPPNEDQSFLSRWFPAWKDEGGRAVEAGRPKTRATGGDWATVHTEAEQRGTHPVKPSRRPLKLQDASRHKSAEERGGRGLTSKARFQRNYFFCIKERRPSKVSFSKNYVDLVTTSERLL